MSQSEIVFSKEELARYSRHLIIPEFNIEGQRKLKAAKVLIVGSGGLGSPMLLYLAAAGVGKIGIVDFDIIDESNLQRQVLFDVGDVGKPKAEVAAKKILGLNPHIEVEVYNTHLTSQNAFEIIKGYDLVADGTDNFPTRYLVNDACVMLGIPNVYASIFRFDGQVSVFNYRNSDGVLGPNYRDLYASPPPPGLVPSCAEGGVLGVLPGIIGSIQASEVIKVITGVGETLSGRLFLFDALSFETRVMKISRDKNNPLNGENPSIDKLIDYDQFCGIGMEEEKLNVKEIDVLELKRMQDSKEEFQLVDVRESYEYDIVNLSGDLIPTGIILASKNKISRDKKVIVHCRSGKRSAKAIKELERKHGFTNLYNLKGGILEYADKVDASLPKY